MKTWSCIKKWTVIKSFQRNINMSTIANAQPKGSITYNVSIDENGQASGNQNMAAPKMPAHLAKRLNRTKNTHKKRGTPAEREAAVEARRQIALQEKQAKARKHIERAEAMVARKTAMIAEAAALEAASLDSQETKK